MPDSGKLIHAAVVLRDQQPQSWDQFMMALREYSAAMNIELVRSPAETLARAQGMALAIQDLMGTLLTAPERFDKMRSAAQGRRPDVRQWQP